MDEPKTQLERFNSKIKNNKIVAALIVMGTVVTGVSTFTNAARNLVAFADVESRPAINGEWNAEVTYDWPGAKYTETFTFGGEGEKVHGTASFLHVKRGFLDGVTKGDGIQFTTRTQEFGGDSTVDVVHRYQGKVARDEIRFVMQTEGSLSAHVPVEFVAHRASGTPAGQAH